MLPIKTSPAKETRRRTGVNGSDVGDIEYAQSHHSSSEGSPQKGLLSNAHHPSDKPSLVSLLPTLHLLSVSQQLHHATGIRKQSARSTC